MVLEEPFPTDKVVRPASVVEDFTTSPVDVSMFLDDTLGKETCFPVAVVVMALVVESCGVGRCELFTTLLL